MSCPIEKAIKDGFHPPSNDSAWVWCEKNIELDGTSAIQGRYSTEIMPFVRAVYDHCQDRDTRQVTMMVSAQSGKTQTAMNFFAWLACEDPATTMWIGANELSCHEFYRKRLEPLIKNCKPTNAIYVRKSRSLVQLTTMNLILRGTNSRPMLQSDPVRWFFCDERREWKKGAIDLLRKRRLTFHNFTEISMGVAGVDNDELHRDFLSGSQSFVHWKCIHCEHEQPFRFGRDPTTLFPDARTKGGVVCEVDGKVQPFKNDLTFQNNKWDYEELKRLARYECESCGHLYKTHERAKLLEGWGLFHRNPKELPKHFSITWPAMYMPWPESSFGSAAVEYVRAIQSAENGNVEPLKAFVTETLGEPWKEKSDRPARAEILNRCANYKMGDEWVTPKSDTVAKVLTVDVQHGYLVYVNRGWKQSGASRLLRCGRLFTFEDLRGYQLEQGIDDGAVFLDSGDGKRSEEIYGACFRYGWTPLKGEDDEYFTEYRDKKPVRVGVKLANINPGEGLRKNNGMPGNMPLWLWSNPTYKNRLYLYIARGISPFENVQPISWELPSDITPDYIMQMQGEERVGDKWKEIAGVRRDFGDCELMQQVVADLAGITRKPEGV